MTQIDGSSFLVIGGAGFIGSHTVERLLDRGAARVTVLDNFVRGSESNLADALETRRVEVVEGSVLDLDLVRRLMEGQAGAFHLAALWLYECAHEPRRALEHNVVGTYNVIEAAHAAGLPRLVYASSASVYGNAREVPMTEDHPFDNTTMYGATKIAGEQFLRAFHERHGLDYVAMRYMNVYGPRMDDQGAYVSVIVKVLERIARGERPTIHGDGTQAFDFVHVWDVARANVLAMAADATDASYNVCTGTRTTITELVAQLLDLTGAELEPEYLRNEHMFVTERVGSTAAAQRDLGFRAEIALRDGLRTLVDGERVSA
ncbi:MAG: NAD-dependent epimerase/dehydratase family protein [Solirubrobacteraceae bacterium]